MNIHLGSRLVRAFLVLIFSVVPLLLFPHGVREDTAYPVSDGTSKLPDPDAKLFADAGIPAAEYSMRSFAADGGTPREYLPRVGPTDLSGLEKKLAEAVDQLRVALPTPRELVARFGYPTKIRVDATGNTVFLNLSYGSVTFFTVAGQATVIEIRFHSPDSPYRLRKSIHVGSKLEDVLTEVGQPAKMVTGTEHDFASDRVLSIVKGNEVERFYISYGSEGVRFFGSRGVVTAMYFFRPGSVARVGEGAPAPVPDFDRKIFRDAGIPVEDYTMLASSENGTAMRTYQPRVAPVDLAALDLKVAAVIDQLRMSPPSPRDLVARFGNPTSVLVADTGTIVFLNLEYGSVTFYMTSKVYVTPEIRFTAPGSPYRLKQAIHVGSKLEDVLAVVGQPVKKVMATEYDLTGDRVLSIVKGGGTERFHISYGSEGVRFFGADGVVTGMYFFRPASSAPAARAVTLAPTVAAVAPHDDVRGKDLSALSGKLDATLLRTLWLDMGTKLDAAGTAVVKQVVEAGRNPGLGVRALHAQGITGKGVMVAIIDQNLAGTDHPEYAGKVAMYRDVGTGHNDARGSMHGPAVLSLLVGTQAGTAPDARVYYAAAPSWLADAKYYADALAWIIEENKKLPNGGKIRVVSVSAAPSGPGSPFTKNGESWDAAVTAATATGVLVLDCTQTYGIIGPCYYDPTDPENVRKATPGFPGQTGWGSSSIRLLAPTSYRSQAESYLAGQNSWQYTGRGGLSWGIPWVAGVLALGWQVNPSLEPEAIVKLLRVTAFERDDGSKIIDPAAFIAAVRKMVR